MRRAFWEMSVVRTTSIYPQKSPMNPQRRSDSTNTYYNCLSIDLMVWNRWSRSRLSLVHVN